MDLPLDKSLDKKLPEMKHSEEHVDHDYASTSNHRPVDKFHCEVCKKTFSYRVNFIKHQTKNHSDGNTPYQAESLFKCNYCEKSFKNSNSLYIHSLIHSSSKRHKYIVMINSSCANIYSGTKRHTQKNLLIWTPKELNSMAITAPILLYHRRSIFEEGMCKFCRKRFFFKRDLRAHEKEHMGTGKPFYCKKCEVSYDSDKALQDHIGGHKDEDFCEICRKSISVCIARKKCADRERKHQCEICLKKFLMKSHLKVHMITHAAEKPHRCSFCRKKFKTALELETHCRNHEKLPCNACGKTFSDKWSLRRHKFTHNKLKIFECPICLKGFKTKVSMVKHHRLHTLERTAQCDICLKRFFTRFDVKLHKLIHEGNKNFSCNICAAQFLQKSHREAHMKTHSGEKIHQCGICDKKFTRNGYLRYHILVHTKEKPIKCQRCQMQFRWHGQLNKHRLANHRPVALPPLFEGD
ncbi:hypothetical protein JTE90_028925 [Oedothorax gibbosus]|uniref:C2H2-type domain-containing protein n=1 Tax=Oedothorax gibbosus TaxID=931172 RepID=A0AAV6VGZ6_9ARAC|nr:hypothetical protein JTE90_028925 [Oedothorax gibbosus]